jgi:adenine-specific DNA-methyltransferase
MSTNNNLLPIEILKDFLNKLFQFESQDLDFGIYKILHYKREEIKNFIDVLLTDTVKFQLKTLSQEEIISAKGELELLAADEVVKKWLHARDKYEEAKLKFYETEFKEKIDQYKLVERHLVAVKVAEDAENKIYNHLALFFSRYYDKGDFISKRRFGKNEKYIVPYNGEETHFYWANQDQYYIKSSESFQKFSFKIPVLTGHAIVNFKLIEAQTELGNVKENENKYFILSDKEPSFNSDEVDLYFEYRSFNDNEKKQYTGNNKQDTLNTVAEKAIFNYFIDQPLYASLFEKVNDKTLLLTKLNHYTRKNKYDFFIHKNLKQFLQRELDFYIKTELVEVEDLYVSETDVYLEKIRQNIKTIKAFKIIADTIIDFLSQIEDFQKKLWEKKKFVLATEWIITIDRLIEYLGEEDSKIILEEVLKNRNQILEWISLFGVDSVPGSGFSVDELKANLHEWRKFPIDTVHFSEVFKENLLNKLSEKINIEEMTDGLVIHSDNFHGINLISEKFKKQIDSIHIDPPYNTNSSGFLYKNMYKHSSWLSMMENRISSSIELLKNQGSYQCHIDENEYENLATLFDNIGIADAGTVVWDKRNPMNNGRGIANQHEYIIWRSNYSFPFKKSSYRIILMLEKAAQIIKKEGGVNDKVRQLFTDWVSGNKDLSGGEKAYKYLDDDGNIYQSVSLRAPEPRKDKKFHKALIHPKTGKPCPVPPNGFSRTPETLKKMMDSGDILFGVDETTQPRQKVKLSKDTEIQQSSMLQDSSKGKKDLEPLGLRFPYCHPTSLYSELLGNSAKEKFCKIFDFFAGSGTTFQATQLLNREDDGRRKCILIEQGDYTSTVILPRIKKIAYTFEWRAGKPKDNSMNGLGVFVKYQKLEQYEESLENISFTVQEKTNQQALQFDQYIPKYFLEFETRESRTTVNTKDILDPWNYTLKVWDGFTYDTEKAVDLVETFNYLIGLHLKKQVTKIFNSKKYKFVFGNNNSGKEIIVVWRNVVDWTLDEFEKDAAFLKQELSVCSYDILYISGKSSFPGYIPIEQVFQNKMVP